MTNVCVALLTLLCTVASTVAYVTTAHPHVQLLTQPISIPPCNDPHDIAIVVDLHKELSDDEFANITRYLKYLSSAFYLDDGHIHLSLVTYGSNVVSYTPLRRWANVNLSTYIDMLKRDSNSGDPTSALTAALKLLVTTVYNPTDDRDDVYFPDVVIIITTQTTDYSADLSFWADQLLSGGYTQILGIAAGDTFPNHITAQVLRYIAGYNDNVVEFESLLEFSSQIYGNNDLTKHLTTLTCAFYPPVKPTFSKTATKNEGKVV